MLMLLLLLLLIAASKSVGATTCSVEPGDLAQVNFCYSFANADQVLGCFYCNQLCEGGRFQSNCLLGYKQVLALVSYQPCLLGSEECQQEFGPKLNATCQAMRDREGSLTCPPAIAIATIGGLATAGALVLVFLLTCFIHFKYMKTAVASEPTLVVTELKNKQGETRKSIALSPAKKLSITNRMKAQSGGRPSQTARTMNLMMDMEKRKSERLARPPPLPTLPPVGSFRVSNNLLPTGPPPPRRMTFMRKMSLARPPRPVRRAQPRDESMDEDAINMHFPESADSLVAQMRAQELRNQRGKKRRG